MPLGGAVVASHVDPSTIYLNELPLPGGQVDQLFLSYLYPILVLAQAEHSTASPGVRSPARRQRSAQGSRERRSAASSPARGGPWRCPSGPASRAPPPTRAWSRRR